jgi:hypothetical protein
MQVPGIWTEWEFVDLSVLDLFETTVDERTYISWLVA